jgi:hypothetical protein
MTLDVVLVAKEQQTPIHLGAGRIMGIEWEPIWNAATEQPPCLRGAFAVVSASRSKLGARV